MWQLKLNEAKLCLTISEGGCLGIWYTPDEAFCCADIHDLANRCSSIFYWKKENAGFLYPTIKKKKPVFYMIFVNSTEHNNEEGVKHHS